MTDDNKETSASSDAPAADMQTDAKPETKPATEPQAEQPETTADAVARAMEPNAETAEEPAKEKQENDDETANQSNDEDETKKDDAEADDEPDEADVELEAPTGISDKARERFDTLNSRLREASDTRDALQTQNEQIVKVMEGTGYSPQEFAQMLVMLGDVNSGDVERMQNAMKGVDDLRAKLARKIGKPVDGVDVLSDYPDLREKVDDGDIDEASAAEIAAARREKTDRATREQAAKKQLQDQQTSADSIQAAQAGLTELGGALKAEDPDYDAKIKILANRGFFDHVSQNVAPEQWETMFATAYDILGDVAATRTPVNRDAQPMRRTANGGGGAPQPKTTEEAVRLALSEG